jgi:Plant specific mitochondrial import receptor subunit TOM20
MALRDQSMRAALLIALVCSLSEAAPAKAATLPAAGPAPVVQTLKETVAELASVRAQIEKAERDKAIAEAKADVMAAGNSRLENWIGLYGILIAVLLASFGFVTFRQAGLAAAKAATDEIKSVKDDIKSAKDEIKSAKDEIDSLLNVAKSSTESIKGEHAKAIQLTAASQALVDKMPGSAADVPVPEAQIDELEHAIKAASEVPRDQRSAQDFRLLMYQARRDEEWQSVLDLAEGMAYLHGENPDSLAHALFGKAYSHSRLQNYELSGILWEDYIRRFSNHDVDNSAWAFNNWGVALMNQAETKTGDAADTMFTAAMEKYADSLRIRPDRHEALSNWGVAFSKQAATKSTTAADPLFAAASEKFAAALEVKPDYYDAYFNWGTTLSYQAGTKTGGLAATLFAEASKKFAAALTIEPGDHEAISGLGTTLTNQAARSKGAERVVLLEQAEEKCHQAEALLPGSGAYNLACAKGLRDDAAGAAEWLRTAKKHGVNCPDCDHIAADSDFDTVRDTPEFQQALIDIGCKAAPA